MARVRGIIIDNSGANDAARKSSIFLNTTSPSVAFLSSKLGEKSLSQMLYEIKKSGQVVQKVTSTTAWVIPTAINIVEIIAEMRGTKPAPEGSSMLTRLRLVRNGQTSYPQTVNIPNKSTRFPQACNLNFIAGDKIYMDVITVGKTKPGMGLIFYMRYYS
jgi:hypothetical protein